MKSCHSSRKERQKRMMLCWERREELWLGFSGVSIQLTYCGENPLLWRGDQLLQLGYYRWDSNLGPSYYQQKVFSTTLARAHSGMSFMCPPQHAPWTRTYAMDTGRHNGHRHAPGTCTCRMDMDMTYYGTGESGRNYAKAQNYAELFRKIPSRVYTKWRFQFIRKIRL